ncbi:MAG: type II toxin-antitoxin system PemK/MazF family toxin [Campylobacterota bacterium]|nr:type II toxin-antitoxin system PemK/MazF family toxin [Campylobacterota bacterium]
MDVFIPFQGAVYHWRNYRFEDNQIQNKFCIILNHKIGNYPVYVVLPTSQFDKHYKNRQDRLIDTVIIKANECKYFTQPITVVDLKQIRKEEKEEIDKTVKEGKLKYKGILEEETIKRIKTAVENSETVSGEVINAILCKNPKN